ncbi:unnamed protein product, partial [marine sediment metagenome]
LTNLTPATVTGGIAINALGRLPIGVYKGTAAFWDLDKAVNQPLVLVEQKYVNGILDAREPNYDLLNIAVPALDPIGTAHTGTLTVPAGEIWYVNTIIGRSAIPGAGSQIGFNWYCSMWTDRVGALGHGQPYHGVEALSAVNTAAVHFDDFHTTGPLFNQFAKDALLRLPAGTVLTAIFTTRTLATTPAAACTFEVYGFIGKILVA